MTILYCETRSTSVSHVACENPTYCLANGCTFHALKAQTSDESDAQVTRANIIRGLDMYDKGAPGKNEVWRAKCDLAKQLKRELEFRVVLDVQDFFLALWLAYPLMQNPMAYMPMREAICRES